jgi:hypothetical protein
MVIYCNQGLTIYLSLRFYYSKPLYLISLLNKRQRQEPKEYKSNLSTKDKNLSSIKTKLKAKCS